MSLIIYIRRWRFQKTRALSFRCSSLVSGRSYRSIGVSSIGLFSITKEQNRFVPVFRIGDLKEENNTTSTNNTKSSNFSSDSLAQSLLRMSEITVDYLKVIKESLKSRVSRVHTSQEEESGLWGYLW